MLFHFFRPKPKCEVGDIVWLNPKTALIPLREAEYLHIRCRWWIRPNGTEKKQWVYDGLVLRIHRARLSVATGISCVSENSLGAQVS